MQVVYGDDCVDVSTVRLWAKKINKSKDAEQVRADLCDQEWSL